MKGYHALLVCWYILEMFDNSTTLPFTSNKDNTKEEWKCRYGNGENVSTVSFSEGIAPTIDIDISAEKINASIRFDLACFSCWIPYMKGVDIFVDNVLEDSIRYHDGQCYHKRKVCTTVACTCSAKGQRFTWTYISDLANIQFKCTMRFKDVNRSTTFIQKAELSFNGTVFIKKHGANESHSNSDKKSDNDDINSGKDGTKNTSELVAYWLLGVFGLIISGIITTIIIMWKLRKAELRNYNQM